jgi:ribosome-binding factor A
MTGHRGERVGQRIQEIIARLLRKEVRDPRIGFVTLTGVELSGDLRHARVFVSSLGSDAERAGALEGLRRAAPFFRRVVARELSLRFAPELVFVEDTGMQRGFRVDSILRDLERERPADEEDPEA